MLESDVKSCWPFTSSCKIELSSAVGLLLMSYWPIPSLCKLELSSAVVSVASVCKIELSSGLLHKSF